MSLYGKSNQDGFIFQEGEQTLLEKLANLFIGFESIGGKLKITNKRVIFESHRVNLVIQKHGLDIEYGEIASVGEKNFLGFIPNGIVVTTKTGQEYKFVVWGRGRILTTIRSFLNK